MNICLYFGSFNPIHNGHLHIARQALQQRQSDEVWLVVSPLNPFKKNDHLAAEEHRLRMAELACAGENSIRVCDVEFHLPRPSYTIDTIKSLHTKNPEHTFQIVIGEDNLVGFDGWKDFRVLLSLVELIVYPRTSSRPTIPHALEAFTSRIHFLSGDLIPVSATDIRNKIERGVSIDGLAPPEVIAYIKHHNLFS